MGVVLQMVQQNHAQAEDGHKRLRGDFRDMERDLDALTVKVAALDLLTQKTALALSTSESAPIDVGKIVFNPRMVLAIIAAVSAIIGGNWLTTLPVRAEIAANAKLQDERNASMHTAIDDVKKAQTLQQLQLNELNTTMATLKGSRR